jgi:hypothetical protein
MRKSILSLLLALCMALTLLPTAALAADLTELCIGSNTPVTLPGNGKYTYGDNSGGAGTTVDTLADVPASATWYLHRDDASSPKYTLTLDEASIPATSNRTWDLSGQTFASAIHVVGDLSIVLLGESTVTGADVKADSFGILSQDSLSVSGDGSLSATGGIVTNNGGTSYGVFVAGTLRITGNATLTGTGGNPQKGGSCGIFGESIRVEENARVTAQAGPAGNYFVSYGIHCSSISIEGNAQVTASADTAGSDGISCGIDCGSMSIEGNAQVTAQAHTAGSSRGGSYGINGSEITIGGNAQVTASADTAGRSYGIQGGFYIWLSGGTTLARGDDQAIYTDYIIADGVTVTGSADAAALIGELEAAAIVDEQSIRMGADGSGLYAKTARIVPSPSATVGNVTVSGTKNTAIANTDVVITLANDTFAGTLSGDWITNLPAGLTQSVSRTDDTHARITVSGTPTAASTAQMAITIPADQLATSSTALTVAANVNAKYSIAARSYTVAITAGANMTTSGDETQTVEEGTVITDVAYTAADGFCFPTDYAVAAQNGISVARDSYTQITVSGTPTANVAMTLADATVKAKESTPGATFTATGPDTGTLSGVTNGMKYSIDGSSWTDITGSTDIPLTGLSACTISVVKKGDGNTTLDSDAQDIVVTKAAVPTTAGKTDCTTADNNGTLTSVTASMEWKNSGGSWTTGDGSAITGLTNGTYYVRVKAAGTVLASDNQELIIAAYVPPAPSDDPGPTHNYYTIRASAGEGGSISSAGGASYREGQGKIFSITPDKGCIIFDVLVDGVSVGPVSAYEFTNIQERHTIEAVFAKGDMANFRLTGGYAGYPDVDEGKWYGTEHEGAVRDATLLGFVEGDGTGFRPEDGIKLSEVVKMAAVVWNNYCGSPYSFDQTEGTHWYDTYVNFAIKYGLLKAGDFADYERNATRAEMAYIFAHALPESELAAISTIIPPDVAKADEYAAEIQMLYTAGVLRGNDEAGTFTGERAITRAEAAAIIIRMALPSVRIAE